MSLVLYGYFRSSASYRVRIGLNLKGLAYEQVPVHLRKGEQFAAAHTARHPQGLVPVLGDGKATLIQSLAILEYLDEAFPETPRLLPADPLDRARVRAIADMIACDIAPIDNLRVLEYLRGPLAQPEEAVTAWYNHWIATGFAALEQFLASEPAAGRFCHGDAPGLAECVLVPQVFNAARFKLDMAPYPRIRSIAEACNALPAFAAAHPKNQPDSEL